MMITELPDTTCRRFQKENALICPGSPVPLNYFETLPAAVEKYLPDTAALSFAGKINASYLTENKETTDMVFEMCFQNT